jgi:cytochrome c-type biogenesis protein CcmF
VAFSLTAALLSMIAYGTVAIGRNDRFLRIGRAGFHGTVIGFILAAAILMYLIQTHQYQYTYVWKHSSNSLDRPFLFAAFYAGQQGSFTLWTLLTGIIGIFILAYSQRVKYEPYVMTIYMLVMVCLLLILVVDSPFETIYATFASANIPAGKIPLDGKGLNPQLENLWITIHPPILFTGFASMTAPFVFALAALIKRDYQRWISVSLPWVLFASMVLGFGIALGGWWAYETLGWGGFWAWDPVENSSFIPWLVCVALVHTMLVQKKTGNDRTGKVGGLVKTNFLLAILAFGLILYSTFLTRSGVLGDTSVHSFVDPGYFVYAVLLSIIVIFVGLGAVLLVRRWKELHQKSLEMRLMSRENALGLGSAVLLASAAVVLIGTSWPIFMPLFGLPKIKVSEDFYNGLHLPIAFVLVLINGIAMTLKWKNTTPNEFYRKIGIATAIAAVGSILLAIAGVTDPIYVALGFGAVLAMVVNIQIGLKVMRGNPRFVGAYVSHAGVALLMLGIIFTARYSETHHVRLVEGEQKQAFGYSISYGGAERIELDKTDREKYQHIITLKKNGATYTAKPVIFWSDFNNRESAFLEPGILYAVSRDVYISPKAIEQLGGDPTVQLHKGDKAKVPFDSSITVRFQKFDMTRAQSEGLQGAVMEVTSGDSTYYLSSYRTIQDGSYIPVKIPGTDVMVGMGGLVADKGNLSNSQVVLVFKSPSHPPPPVKDVITVDVSIKPFISFVWSGVIIMVGGFAFSIIRRRKELGPLLRRIEDEEEEEMPEEPQPTPKRMPTLVDEPVAARIVTRR